MAYIYGFLSILLFSPLLSLAMARMPLSPPEFAHGLALFMAMPTTVSSGVLMTGEARGNVALSVFFSAGTNIIGVVTVPFFLSGIFQGVDSGSVFNPLTLLWQLTVSILVPLAVGKALRWFVRVVDFVKRWKLQLKLLSSFLLIMVPWTTMSQSSEQLHATCEFRDTRIFSLHTSSRHDNLVFASRPAHIIDTQEQLYYRVSQRLHLSCCFPLAAAGSFFIALGIGFHLVLLVANYAAAAVLPMGGLAERKSVVINASQKTVNTAMSVLQFLPATLGNRGLLTLPCIISHFVQIIMDAYIVSYWKNYTDAAPVPGAPPAADSGTVAASPPSGEITPTPPPSPPPETLVAHGASSGALLLYSDHPAHASDTGALGRLVDSKHAGHTVETGGLNGGLNAAHLSGRGVSDKASEGSESSEEHSSSSSGVVVLVQSSPQDSPVDRDESSAGIDWSTRAAAQRTWR